MVWIDTCASAVSGAMSTQAAPSMRPLRVTVSGSIAATASRLCMTPWWRVEGVCKREGDGSRSARRGREEQHQR